MVAKHEDKADSSWYHYRLDSHYSPIGLWWFQLWQVRSIYTILIHFDILIIILLLFHLPFLDERYLHYAKTQKPVFWVLTVYLYP